jgi:hypothetical protein
MFVITENTMKRPAFTKPYVNAKHNLKKKTNRLPLQNETQAVILWQSYEADT